MQHTARSMRPFIGAKDYEVSRAFYTAMGFNEYVASPGMSVFRIDGDIRFYLQRYYVKDWIDNLMLFLEVDGLDKHHAALKALNLPDQFDGVRVSEIQVNDWGREYFVHDPSGILWHIGEFVS